MSARIIRITDDTRQQAAALVRRRIAIRECARTYDDDQPQHRGSWWPLTDQEAAFIRQVVRLWLGKEQP